jgi:DnaJ family protein C protein 19
MFPLVAGLAALIIGIVVIATFARADARALAHRVGRPSVVLSLLLTVGLISTGRISLAFLSGIVAYALITGVRIPGFGTRDRHSQFSEEKKRNAGTQMSREEALEVLGLPESADADEVRAAHRRLIQQIHPDKGGTNYLAAKINAAKDTLLGE